MQGTAPGDPVALPMPDPSEMLLVEVIFPTTGTNQISVEAGEPVTTQIRITTGASGIAAFSLPVQIKGLEDFIEVSEVHYESTTGVPAGFDFALSSGFSLVEDAAGTSITIIGCDAASLGAGVSGGSFIACEFAFDPGSIDGKLGPRTEAAFFRTSVDGMLSSSGADLSEQVVFIPGTIEVVPEADAVAASAAAAIALATLARSRRRLSERH
jgi:hypothetical protein